MHAVECLVVVALVRSYDMRDAVLCGAGVDAAVREQHVEQRSIAIGQSWVDLGFKEGSSSSLDTVC
jgi:hypothetical protein